VSRSNRGERIDVRRVKFPVRMKLLRRKACWNGGGQVMVNKALF